jgi:outer membrane protein assembly factor BamB
MTKLLPNSPTPALQNKPKLSKPSCTKRLVGFGLFAVFALSACSGRDIHSDLVKRDSQGLMGTENTKVLIRNWVLSTHGPFQAGDHGTEYSNPVVYENTLIFGNQSVGLISIYPKLGQQRWSFPVKSGVINELAIDKDSVYFGGGDGFLYSLNADTGKVNWKYEVRNPMISRPTIADGRVFITTSDDTIYAFDAGTGKWLWHYRRRTSPSATILGASAPLVDGNDVIAGLSDGFLVELSMQDGQLKWERKLHNGTKFTDVDAHPVLEDGVIYIPSYDGALYALKRQTGEIIWRFDIGGAKTVILSGDRLYFPGSDGTIYALQKSNAKLIWKFELDGGVPTQLAETDQYLIVGSSFQYLYAIDKETGKGAYRFNVGYGSGFAGAPAFDPATQKAYILSDSGNLYSFTVRRAPHKLMVHAPTDPYSAF